MRGIISNSWNRRSYVLRLFSPFFFTFPLIFLLSSCSSEQEASSEVSQMVIEDNAKDASEYTEENWIEDDGEHLRGTPEKDGYIIYTGYNYDFGDSIPEKNRLVFYSYNDNDQLDCEIFIPGFALDGTDVTITFEYNGKDNVLRDVKDDSYSFSEEDVAKKMHQIYNMT